MVERGAARETIATYIIELVARLEVQDAEYQACVPRMSQESDDLTLEVRSDSDEAWWHGRSVDDCELLGASEVKAGRDGDPVALAVRQNALRVRGSRFASATHHMSPNAVLSRRRRQGWIEATNSQRSA
jgi:hypothetical protein